jgi:hypothetical protein
MKILIDIADLFKTFEFLDYILFFAVILLVILIIILIYFIKINENNPVIVETQNDFEEPEFSSFEEEQEKKAIISYSELKGFKDIKTLHEEETTTKDGLTVKKINITNDVETDNYHDEKEFLETLKKLKDRL